MKFFVCVVVTVGVVVVVVVVVVLVVLVTVVVVVIFFAGLFLVVVSSVHRVTLAHFLGRGSEQSVPVGRRDSELLFARVLDDFRFR
jgi:hypothetical protein